MEYACEHFHYRSRLAAPSMKAPTRDAIGGQGRLGEARGAKRRLASRPCSSFLIAYSRVMSGPAPFRRPLRYDPGIVSLSQSRLLAGSAGRTG